MLTNLFVKPLVRNVMRVTQAHKTAAVGGEAGKRGSGEAGMHHE
jgi:hypothetical protein